MASQVITGVTTNLVTLEDHVLVESIVRVSLGLKDHRVVQAVASGSRIYVELDRIRRRRLPCSECGRRCRVRDRLPERAWRHVPLWGTPVSLLYEPCRVLCRDCGVKVEAIPWSLGKSPLSQPLVVVLAFWSRLLPWYTVGQLFGASWTTVRTAVRHAVDYGIQMREDDEVLHIGIDEISRRRGHIYHTQVYDLQGKRLLWSAEGRDADTLRRFFDELGPERCAKIRAVCCDMWAAYVDVVKEKVPQAILVFDKFHIVRHLLDAVNDVRKAEAKELRKEGCELLKGTRYIWLKNPWNLTPGQSARLSDLERLNLKVNRAYLLKETFRHIWTYKRKGWAKRFFEQWFWWATHSRLEPLRKFAWMIRNHIDGVLAWFEARIDNGATEAMNNNAKAVSHRARGYRTADTFSLALMHCLGKLPLPATVHKFW